MIKFSPASARDSNRFRCLGDGSGIEHVQRLSHRAIRTVTKLANRVAARVGKSVMACIYRGTLIRVFQNYELSILAGVVAIARVHTPTVLSRRPISPAAAHEDAGGFSGAARPGSIITETVLMWLQGSFASSISEGERCPRLVSGCAAVEFPGRNAAGSSL